MMTKQSQAILKLKPSGAGSDRTNQPDRRQVARKSFYVYRHYDQDENLLYIGFTDAPSRRLREHMRESPWRAQLASVSIKRFASEQEAIDAERSAILDEQPIWNKKRVPVRPEVKFLFQVRLPEALHMKLAWLSKVLPGKPSMNQLLIIAVEEFIHRQMIELAAAQKMSVTELYEIMEAETRSNNPGG